MNHTAAKVKVFCTTDYSLFKMVDGNRPINKKKVERIIKEIKAGNDVLDECPILVTEQNGHMDIKDGQHRFQIAKQLKRAVHYIIHEQQMSLYNVATMNSNTEKWTAENFINCYATAGNENYIRLKQFRDKYNIAIGSCLTLLTYGVQKNDGLISTLYDHFQQGTFEIKTYKQAVQYMELCKSFSEYKYWTSRAFLISMTKILQAGKCDMDVLLKKFNENPLALIYSPDWKKIIANLEEIYNKGNTKRRTIF
jgi:hypothetical protein